MLSVTTSALCDVCDWCRMTSCVLLPVVLVARAAVYVCMACVIEVVQHCTVHQYIATTATCIACATSCGSLHELEAGAALYNIYSVTSCVLLHVASIASKALYYMHGLSNILCITACCVSSQCSHVLLYAWLEQGYYCMLHQ